ncbi:MAG TPA: CHRD domain-containing protein [Deltaproteobacteria bacterium]|jgi:hypothetical protein|nr:CHRD domain-containing protein [Deltaproteobacteria bacterium]HOI06492.1 CHRD domain-containing protein [Deltaproteobacteria bacterium]
MTKRLFSIIALTCAMMLAAQISYAVPITYTAVLTGSDEVPSNASPAMGTSMLVIDTDANLMTLDVAFSDLLAPTTAAHIHAPTEVPGEGIAPPATPDPTPVDFPLNVTSGTYTNTFDTTDSATYHPDFIEASGGTVELAETALAQSLANGTAYFNIHTTLYPTGEIRGFYQPESQAPAPVPEPATMMLLASGLIGVFGLKKRYGRQAS